MRNVNPKFIVLKNCSFWLIVEFKLRQQLILFVPNFDDSVLAACHITAVAFVHRNEVYFSLVLFVFFALDAEDLLVLKGRLEDSLVQDFAGETYLLVADPVHLGVAIGIESHEFMFVDEDFSEWPTELDLVELMCSLASELEQAEGHVR